MLIFFFQAEDGIRDLVRSRGLGDVYKRQVHGGILFTLADHIGGACGNTLGKKSLLIESTMQFMKGVLAGETLFAEAKLCYAGKRIGRIEIKVYRENEEIVAMMHMVFYMKSDDHKTKTP